MRYFPSFNNDSYKDSYTKDGHFILPIIHLCLAQIPKHTGVFTEPAVIFDISA